ncbi:MAG: hypothetical protein JWN02_249 [Acidobacteria bacterium]|nr:hypothetical protein [Acidobacteriota bacterium]
MKRLLPLLLAVAAYYVAAIVWIGHDKRVPQQAFDKLSSENTSKEGTSLARRYLAGRGHRVVALKDPLDVTTAAANGVVFRFTTEPSLLARIRSAEQEHEQKERRQVTKKADKPRRKKNAAAKGDPKRGPAMAPLDLDRRIDPLLTDGEEEWVRRGGRFVLASSDTSRPLAARNSTARIARKVFPIWPGLDSVELPEARTIGNPGALRRAHTLFAIGDQPAIASEPIGAGELIVMTTPEAFANDRLADPKRLALLEALAGERRPVYFDETLHGLQSSVGPLDLLESWNLGPMLLLLTLVAALLFWRYGTRTGRAEDDYRDTRSEAIDVVESLGTLYDRSMYDGEALALYHRELTRAVAAHTGLRGEALQKKVNELTNDVKIPRQTRKLPARVFAEILARLNESFRRLEHANRS